ncbi:hypothetical protein L9F63_024208, partial [Diploptera punctata]
SRNVEEDGIRSVRKEKYVILIVFFLLNSNMISGFLHHASNSARREILHCNHSIFKKTGAGKALSYRTTGA